MPFLMISGKSAIEVENQLNALEAICNGIYKNVAGHITNVQFASRLQSDDDMDVVSTYEVLVRYEDHSWSNKIAELFHNPVISNEGEDDYAKD